MTLVRGRPSYPRPRSSQPRRGSSDAPSSAEFAPRLPPESPSEPSTQSPSWAKGMTPALVLELRSMDPAATVRTGAPVHLCSVPSTISYVKRRAQIGASKSPDLCPTHLPPTSSQPIRAKWRTAYTRRPEGGMGCDNPPQGHYWPANLHDLTVTRSSFQVVHARLRKRQLNYARGSQ